MSGERLDYSIERQRHDGFIGRTALLTQLDQILVTDSTDRWVVVTGGPGMGKSALLAAWLARREAAGDVVPHHFIRRGGYDWDDPARLVSSLVGQIEERFPGQHESAEDAQKHPAARLAAMLMRVSAKQLVPHGKRLVVLIDGLDEYDPEAGGLPGDPLAAFLPHALPRGVTFVCASRPRDLYVQMIEARDGEFVRIDLDAPTFAAENDATVVAFWQQAAPALGLDARFLKEAVARACGNLQHAVMLRKHIAGMPAAQRRVGVIAPGLAALLRKLWQRVTTDPAAVRGLGILCAAREALTLDEIGAVAGWTDEAQRQAFLGCGSELLVESRRSEDQSEYRLHHDAIREHIVSTLGSAVVRGHQAALARHLATWPTPTEATARRYALRHALSHRIEAGDWTDAWRLASDMAFLMAKCCELGVHETEADVARAAERCRMSGDESIRLRFEDLARSLMREAHWLREAPAAIAALVWNRLKRLGWSTQDLNERLAIPVSVPFLRLRHGIARESPALLRDLVGHRGWVTACAVTSDSRFVVSASGDKTLKIWDLDTGNYLANLEGHTGNVNACAITIDGRVVSASADGTLKLWALDTGRLLGTLSGHSDSVCACAVTSDGRFAVSGSRDSTLKVWDLTTLSLSATLKGHTAFVTGCAVTPDGRVISTSEDNTLKVWTLDGGLVTTLGGHTQGVTSCAITPDGHRVVSASLDKTLTVWDLDNYSIVAILEGHTASVEACAITGDGRRVVSASKDQTLKLWDAASGRSLGTLHGHGYGVTACAVTPDGRRVVSGSIDYTLKIWDLDINHIVSSDDGHADRVNACTVTPDGRRVISASQDKLLKVWDIAEGRLLKSLRGHTSAVTACAVTPDGRGVVSASDDRTLKIWDVDSGVSLTIQEAPVRACAVTSDGRYVVSASLDKSVTVWSLDDGRLVSALDCQTYLVTACSVTPDGRRVVLAFMNETLQIWNLVTGRLLVTLRGHGHSVTACVVTPDGRRVISASSDQTLKIWDIDTGSVLSTLEGHGHSVTAVAVTPDGRHLVSASRDHTLKVWNLDTYSCLLTHRGDAAYLSVVATSTGVVAGDVAGTVWFLDWPPVLPLETSDRQGQDSTTKRNVILFLAANPSGTTHLALDKECRAIESELSMTPGRDDFDFQSRWAVGVDDMMRHLNKLQPAVIHFSGHGGGIQGIDTTFGQRQAHPPHRDIGVGVDAGIHLQDEQGQPQYVSSVALTKMVRSAAPSARVVVLNACFSDELAENLLGVVDCVVGMQGAIGDDAARSFAVGFYRSLGFRRSVGNAVEQAVATLAGKQFPDEHLPVCRTRDGVNADQMVLPRMGSDRGKPPTGAG